MTANKTLIGIFAISALLGSGCNGLSSEDSEDTHDSYVDRKGKTAMEKAMFGAGCFWGVESAFRQITGVTTAAVGYSGGEYEHPSYEDVCTGKTGHTEVVLVEYDPTQITYGELLQIFWKIHDPTTINRQGPDVGFQYRSVIFFFSPEQQVAALESKRALEESGKWERPIVTAIEPAKTFWLAEEYHQRYLEKHGRVSCHWQ